MTKHNKLTQVEYKYKKKSGTYWLFICECGNEKVINLYRVRSGHVKSCGCLAANLFKRTHGCRNKPIYYVWRSMKRRCLNTNTSSYKNYGGRGIKVCARWMKFENFYADMGEKPEGMSLDRIDNDGNYEPSNCKWSTRIEQGNNTRVNRLITYQGTTKTVAEWARSLNINSATLRTRLYQGWSIERAFSTTK